MKTNSNIYDIDGEIIRSAGDGHKWTVEEAKQQMEKYREKLKNMDEKDPKAVVYATYMRNLSNYIMAQYASMSKAELQAHVEQNSDKKTTEEQINQAIEELKSSLDEEPKETVMDEYVDFEEIPEN